jgi:uncharacterized protein (DUF2141 family)
MVLVSFAAPAHAQFRQEISNDPSRCQPGKGPAVQITVTDVRVSSGTMRVQLYRGTQQDWLASGRWLYRMEAPARAGRMSFCMPVPQAGTYGIAIRHDVNGNGGTDLTRDGGGMSNNPSINIFNLGKPNFRRTAFTIGNEVKPMSIQMRYLAGS